MKTLAIFLLSSLLLSGHLFAGDVAKALPEAEKLVAKKQFLAAYQLIHAADPENRDLEAVLFLNGLLWNYYASRIGSDFFALRDLKPDERIEDVRGGEGTFDMVMFETEKILSRMLEEHPEEGRLHRALGNYCYNQWQMHREAATAAGNPCSEAAIDHYAKALKAGIDDDSMRFKLGHIHLSAGRLAESIKHFEKCVEQNSDYAAAHFNLASARLGMEAAREALPHAKRAMELYAEPDLKSDAASLTGDILAELGENAEALRHYVLADEFQPNAYPNIKSLLLMRLRENDPESESTARRLMALDPENPRVFSDLEEVYRATDRADKLVGLLSSCLDDPDEDRPPVVTGNLHFYFARLHMASDPKLARRHYAQAREWFAKKFPPEHEVFKIIDDQLKEDPAGP